MALRWGVLGARARVHRQRLRPAMALAGQRVVAEGSMRGEDLSAYDAVVTDPDVDAVYVPLPNSMHAEWVAKALECGKHVLCEKPLTLSPEDTVALYEVAADSGRHLGEAYVWPHHPRSQVLLELVAAGALGRLVAVHGVFHFPVASPDDHRLDARGGGALLDVGIYCLGPPLLMAPDAPVGPLAASAVRNAAGVDIATSGWIGLGPGSGASFSTCCVAPLRRFQEVLGTDGSVAMDDPTPGPDHAGALVIHRAGGHDAVPYAGASSYERMVSAFEAEVHGDAAPRWPATQSIRLAHLVAALHQATSGANGTL